jgi:hydroxypyruvate isomerase
MERRHFLASASLAAAASSTVSAAPAGRLKQSVCRWCYGKIPIDDFAAACARIGIQAIDLLPKQDWPVAFKHGLALTCVPGPPPSPTASTARKTTPPSKRNSK